jgi:hypothetical protein
MQARQLNQMPLAAWDRRRGVGIDTVYWVGFLVDTGIHLLQQSNLPLQIPPVSFFLLAKTTGCPVGVSMEGDRNLLRWTQSTLIGEKLGVMI